MLSSSNRPPFQIEHRILDPLSQREAIVVHGGCGLAEVPRGVGLDTPILSRDKAISYTRQPAFRFFMNKTG